MENPRTWTKAEHVVADAIDQHDKDRESGLIGLSLYRRITDALRREGLLLDAELKTPKDCL